MADRYFIGADGSSLNSTANWSETSGGAGGATMPNSTTDTAIFDANSGSATCPTSFEVFGCNVSDFPDGKTINMANNTNFRVRATFVGNAYSPFILGGSGTVILGYTSQVCTFTFNGIEFDCPLTIQGTGTKTIVGNCSVNGLLTIPTSSSQTISGTGTTITCYGGMSLSSNSSGTTTYIFAGGTVSSSSATTGNCGNPKRIDASSNTVTFGTYFRSSGNFTYVSGVVDMTANTFYSVGTGLITSVNGENSMEFGNFIQTSTAFTIGSDLIINGLFTVGSTDQTLGHATYKIFTKGGITAQAAYITFGGAGLWIQGGVIQSAGGHLLGNITFDGDCSLSGSVRFRACSLYYNSGNVTTTGALMIVSSSANFYVGDNITWDNLVVSNRSNSLSSTLYVRENIICNSLYLSPEYMTTGASTSIDITDTKKITTEELFTAENEFTSASIISSGTGLLYCTGTYADRKIYGCMFENIDASETTTPVYTWQGTVTNCVNIFAVDGQDIGGGGAGVSITEY